MSSAVAVYGSGDGDEASSDIVDSEDLGMGCRRRRLSQSDVEPRQLRTAPVNRGALNPGSLAQPPQQDSGPRLSIATPTSVGLRGKALGQDLASGPREDSDWANSPGVEVLFATHTVATGRIGVPPLPAGQALAQGLGPRANRCGVGAAVLGGGPSCPKKPPPSGKLQGSPVPGEPASVRPGRD
jgi:hypothetical protein